MNQNFIIILQTIVTIFIAFITAFLTNNNERKKQTTVFFKQEGIGEQKAILDFWSSVLFINYEATLKRYKKENLDRIMEENDIIDEEKIDDVDSFKLVQKDSYIYSSKLTLKYIGYYMQETFKEKKEQKSILQIFLVGKIISNMKYDFTGERTSVLDLLKIKINDLDWHKKINIYWYEIKYFIILNIFKV